MTSDLERASARQQEPRQSVFQRFGDHRRNPLGRNEQRQSKRFPGDQPIYAVNHKIG